MKTKRKCFAMGWVCAMLIFIGIAMAKEDYDFDVSSASVSAAVWGRVSYIDNSVFDDSVIYNMHLYGNDSYLITFSNRASMLMKAKKGTKVRNTKSVYVYYSSSNITTQTWDVSSSANNLVVDITIEGVTQTHSLTD